MALRADASARSAIQNLLGATLCALGETLCPLACLLDCLLCLAPRRVGRRRYQQNLAGRRLALVVLTTSHWDTIRANGGGILPAVGSATVGSFVIVEMPKPPRQMRIWLTIAEVSRHPPPSPV